ncbi:hypothetical protein LX36DRAFT_61297 [Colletotrichum falcatum]|nr:hypothetical protein LX36DRAFT_61297 [Colletotrichum falcatum]
MLSEPSGTCITCQALRVISVLMARSKRQTGRLAEVEILDEKGPKDMIGGGLHPEGATSLWRRLSHSGRNPIIPPHSGFSSVLDCSRQQHATCHHSNACYSYSEGITDA